MTDLFVNIIVFLLAGIALSKSSAWVVTSLKKISVYLKINKFVIGFILTAIATSLPELFVGIASAIEGNPQFALGTVIGSNIANITLVAGISIIFAGNVSARKLIQKKDAYYMAGILALLVLLLLDGEFSRVDGVLLIIVYAAYAYHLLKGKIAKMSLSESTIPTKSLKQFGIFTGALVLLIFSAEILVKSAESVAISLNLPIVLIGLILVALGTSIPELAVNIEAIKSHAKDMVMGDLLGSVVINSTVIIGLIAIISPIQVKYVGSVDMALFFMMFAILIFIIAMLTDKKFTKSEGLFFVLAYFFYVSISYLGYSAFK